MALVPRALILHFQARRSERTRQRCANTLSPACQFLVRSGAHSHNPIMVEAFVYRPKFVDIRVNKPNASTMPRADGERHCDRGGCDRAGMHRAPKSRENDREFWWFCAEHAAEYNRRWNYFAGMTDDELRTYEAAERAGHRPTWTFRASPNDRLSAARQEFQAGRKRADPFGFFRDGQAAPEPRQRSVGRVQAAAFDALNLAETATGEEVRARYAELVKRYHPDSNGGDRSAEAQLHKVIRAYQTLKTGGLA